MSPEQFFERIDDALYRAAGAIGVDPIDLNPVLAVVLVGLTCGLVGSLVVGSRMAFFSDAMAHTAFAGVAVALLAIVLAADVRSTRGADPYLWVVPWVMGGIGIATGLAIAVVRERTGLTNDTVIGVFFALAVGFGAMLLPALKKRVSLDPDQFLLGSVVVSSAGDLFNLLVLFLVTAAVVAWRFNAIVFASFNPSLARSRGVGLRVNNYLFIVLLALVVNITIKSVGVLLINALLVVPAAAAANLCRNLRQVFWVTLAGSVAAGVIGQQVSRHAQVPIGGGQTLTVGPGGTIVVVCVAWFFLTMAVAVVRGRAGGSAGDRAA